MNGSKIFEKWLDRVAYDMDTVKAMLQTRRLVYAIFMCQQALEKCFKAVLSFQGREIAPIHNLRRLAELADVVNDLDESTLIKLDPFGGAKLRPSGRCLKRRSGSTLSPRPELGPKVSPSIYAGESKG